MAQRIFEYCLQLIFERRLAERERYQRQVMEMWLKAQYDPVMRRD